ncbi:COG1361 S-layer family protein [Ruminococcus sp. 5_1_39BFAA]|uniref:COG1361 S-layer family protein n=1 Tax=Ruminococcus sp. 5_1_39BFAA TaxID=457412 RepID=UPI0035676015
MGSEFFAGFFCTVVQAEEMEDGEETSSGDFTDIPLAETLPEENVTSVEPENSAEEPLSEEAGGFVDAPDAIPDTPAFPTDSQIPGNPETMDTKVYLGLDNLHIYEGMEQSFSDGYRPTVKDGILELVIPYVASGSLKGSKLTVNLEFLNQKQSPVELKNYQKDIWKKGYFPAEDIMQEDMEGTAKEAMGYTETYLYVCRIPIRKDAEPGQYSLTAKAWGYTENMEEVSLEHNIFFYIPDTAAKDNPKQKVQTANDDSRYAGGGGEPSQEIIRQPKMLLESCSLSEKELEAGSTKLLQVCLRNRSQTQSMYNLKITLQTGSASLKLERNSFYFEKVAPGESISLEGKVKVAPDAEAGIVPLSFSFEYEDKKGTSDTGSELVNLSVSQPVKMELEKSEIPAILYASDTVEIPVEVLNLSRTDVYNVRVRLEGTGLFPTADVFIGNMEAGSSGSGSMKVYVGTKTMESIGVDNGTEEKEKYGAVSGRFALSYEDASGNTYEESREYQTEIKKAQVLSLKTDEETEKANPWWISVFAALILGMTAMLLLLLAKLHRKNILLEESRKV